MSMQGPALPDLMLMLADLLPTHLLCNEKGVVKQLRLVSKDVGSIALTAVTSCELHLGEGADFANTQQLVGLLAGAKLQDLKINLNVTSGV